MVEEFGDRLVDVACVLEMSWVALGCRFLIQWAKAIGCFVKMSGEN